MVHLRRSADRIARRVRAKGVVAQGIRVRLKTSSFELLSRQCRLARPADTAEVFLNVAEQLLDQFAHDGPFQLVGMAAFDLSGRDDPLQYTLFKDSNRRELETAIDQLATRFGADAVVRGRDLGQSGTVVSIWRHAGCSGGMSNWGERSLRTHSVTITS
jgi:DNA polymerase IV